MIRKRLTCDTRHIQIPCRNQDVVSIHRRGYYQWNCVIGVVDGWSNPHIIRGSFAGRAAARYVSRMFPKFFTSERARDPGIRARNASLLLEREFLKQFPAHVSAVGAFLFVSEDHTTVVCLGTVLVLEWVGRYWRKIRGLGNHSLDPYRYPSDTSRFWGRGELKADPTYQLIPDVSVITGNTPILVATDGLSRLMGISQVSRLTSSLPERTSIGFLTTLHRIAAEETQLTDDVSVLIRGEIADTQIFRRRRTIPT